jgi:hypothetical protein
MMANKVALKRAKDLFKGAIMRSLQERLELRIEAKKSMSLN